MMEDKGGLIEYSDSIQRQIHVLNSTRSFAIESNDLKPKTFWEKVASKFSISRIRKKWSQKRRVQRSGSFSELDNGSEGQVLSDSEAFRTVLFNETSNPKDPSNSVNSFESNRVSTTKYTVLTFVPKSLYEQYRRVANIYFTAVAVLSLTPYSPVSPVTTVTPLILVIGTSIVREAIEDWRRYKADDELNNRRVEVLDPAKQIWEKTKWKNLEVGNVVRINKNEDFPADLLFLSAAGSGPQCYVETANLDGETNLKLKKAPNETLHLYNSSSVSGFRGVCECELPNPALYTFSGALRMLRADRRIPLNAENLLLRGTKLRNTEYVIGGVVYAGSASRVQLNSLAVPSKRSHIERAMDKVILAMLLLLTILCLTTAITLAVSTERKGKDMWYLEPDEADEDFDPDRPGLIVLTSLVTSFILYGYLIPISLYVSLEIVKVIQVWIITKDLNMYDPETDTPALYRTSNLNEELGQVETILSDKTGTLTVNQMEFFKLSVAGKSYGRGATEIEIAAVQNRGKHLNGSVNGDTTTEMESSKSFKPQERFFNFHDAQLENNAWLGSESEERKEVMSMFFRLLAVCHTVVAEGERTPEEIKYEAESPDESALVVAAKRFGFFFYNRKPSGQIQVREVVDSAGATVEKEYDILEILEFSSARKRMSVILREVKSSDPQILLFTKGADSVIFPRLSAEGRKYEEETLGHLENYGSAGLRTLTCAYRVIEPDVYSAWHSKYAAARTALTGRDDKLAEVADEIEQELTLLGATAIEDKLQDGVPHAISALGDAGIRVWILTGDKQETAINVGYACWLIKEGMCLHDLSLKFGSGMQVDDKVAEEAEKGLDSANETLMENTGAQHAVVIDGLTLAIVLSGALKEKFLDLASRCKSVICCRVSPKQKAQITYLVKTRGRNITLAIGDGANDVGMIQAADIGVGLSGHEGRQAVMASDVAIAQFRFLSPLLLVHGRISYIRITRLISYFFYKNTFIGVSLFFYNIFAFSSGQTIFDDVALSAYNLIFTALPPIVTGIFDFDTSLLSGIRFPFLYHYGQDNRGFSVLVVGLWIFTGIAHGVLSTTSAILYISWTADRENGRPIALHAGGLMLFTSLVVLAILQHAVQIKYWTFIHHISTWGSIALWVLFMVITNFMDPEPFNTFDLYRLYVDILSESGTYVLQIVVTVTALLMPYIIFTTVRRHLYPTNTDIVEEIEAKERSTGRTIEVKNPESIAGISKRTSSIGVEKNTGYAFSGPAEKSLFWIAIDKILKAPIVHVKRRVGFGRTNNNSESDQ